MLAAWVGTSTAASSATSASVAPNPTMRQQKLGRRPPGETTPGSRYWGACSSHRPLAVTPSASSSCEPRPTTRSSKACGSSSTDVMVKDAAAIDLYERLGWRRIGTAEHDNGQGANYPAYLYVSPDS